MAKKAAKKKPVKKKRIPTMLDLDDIDGILDQWAYDYGVEAGEQVMYDLANRIYMAQRRSQ